jgi:hypothetical protein
MRFLLIVYLFLSPNGDPHPVTIPQSTAASYRCRVAHALRPNTTLKNCAP